MSPRVKGLKKQFVVLPITTSWDKNAQMQGISGGTVKFARAHCDST